MVAKKPTTEETIKSVNHLLELIAMTGKDADRRKEVHQRLQSRWGNLAIGAAWGAALGASISTLSIWADRDGLAAGLAIVTAALSTFLATATPTDRSTKHRVAAAGFDGLSDKLRILQSDVDEVIKSTGAHRTAFDPTIGQYYDEGDYNIVGADAKKAAACRKRFDDLQAKYQDLKAASPGLSARDTAPPHVV